MLLLLATGAAAQTPAPHDTADARPAVADTVIPLEGVVVSTVRPTATTGGSSAVVAAPDSLHVVPAPTLAEVLEELPFVAVRTNSRGQAELSVRGSESRQVAVLLDGIPLTLGWDHRTDPSVVPITGARRITIVRGLHSVLYGPNVLGGVVEVGLSSAAAPPPPYRVAAGLDPHGFTAGATAAHGLETLHGDWTVSAGAGVRRRTGVTVPDAARDTLSLRPGLRANSDLEHVDGFAAARFEGVGGAWGGLTLSGYRAERGVPPELHVQSPRLWRYPHESRTVLVASGGSGARATGWGTGDVEASVGLDVGETRISSFPTADYRDRTGSETGDDRTLTVRLLGDHTVGSMATLTAAATLADVLHTETVDEGAPSRYRQRLWSAASELSVRLGGSGRVSGGFALDGSDTPESGDKPPLGTLSAWGGRLGFSALATERTRVHAAVSRRARFPSLRELYSGALGRFAPNPHLRTETLLGFEAGITAGLPVAELQAVVFHHRLDDAIVREAAGDGRYRRVNRDGVRSTGLELFGDVRFGRARVSADATLQHVSLDGLEGADRRPEHQPSVRAGATASVRLPLELTAVLAPSFTGAQYCVHPDTGADTRLAPGGTLDLGLRRVWAATGAPIRVSAFLDNATDAVVHDQCGLPGPGRTLRVSIEIG